jgi:hypothetical protein
MVEQRLPVQSLLVAFEELTKTVFSPLGNGRRLNGALGATRSRVPASPIRG